MSATPSLTVYRRLGARLFEEAVQASGLAPGVLGSRLRDELSRPTLTAPTLRAWRRGNKAVPLAAFLATCRIANIRPGSVVARVLATSPNGAEDADLLALLLELQSAPVLPGARG